MHARTVPDDEFDYTTLSDGTIYGLERPTQPRPRTPLTSAQALAAAQQALNDPGTRVRVRGHQVA